MYFGLGIILFKYVKIEILGIMKELEWYIKFLVKF